MQKNIIIWKLIILAFEKKRGTSNEIYEAEQNNSQYFLQKKRQQKVAPPNVPTPFLLYAYREDFFAAPSYSVVEKIHKYSLSLLKRFLFWFSAD